MKGATSLLTGVLAFGVCAQIGCNQTKPATNSPGSASSKAPLDPLEAARRGVAPTLPPEPKIPGVCSTLRADKAAAGGNVLAADEVRLDTTRIQAAIDACARGSAVKLVSEGTANAFVSGPLMMADGVTLWIDANTTLFASRDPREFDSTQGKSTCGTDENDDSNGCKALINVEKVSDVGVVGEGVIDGRGGEPMLGGSKTWWDVAQSAKLNKTKHSNPRLIDVKKSKNFVLYKVHLYNSPKFHVGINAAGYVVWGVKVLTPSRATNSLGKKLTPFYARNTDGVDPSSATDGVIAYSDISVGDDQIAIKGGNSGPTSRLLIAHNHFGSGHGMSIGSETNGGVSEVNVFDLTIDGSVPTGGAPDVDLNGIRIKSDPSRGGTVTDITYTDVCMRGLPNPIIITPAYDKKATGLLIPEFKNIVLNHVHSLQGSGAAITPIVTLMGYDSEHLLDATLNNVIVDGIAPSGVKAAFAELTFGTGPVNFTASGDHVDLVSDVTARVAPRSCADQFTKL
jgi:polygalacturonase